MTTLNAYKSRTKRRKLNKTVTETLTYNTRTDTKLDIDVVNCSARLSRYLCIVSTPSASIG